MKNNYSLHILVLTSSLFNLFTLHSMNVQQKKQAALDEKLINLIDLEQPNISDIETVINEGANVNAISQEGIPALHLAIYRNSEDVIQLLLNQRNIDINIQDEEEQETPLHLAAINENITLMTLLLNHSNINVNIKDIDQQTPLHCSIEYNKSVAVALLIKHRNIDVNIKDDEGEAPLDIALRKKMYSIIGLLLTKSTIALSTQHQKQLKDIVRNRSVENAGSSAALSLYLPLFLSELE